MTKLEKALKENPDLKISKKMKKLAKQRVLDITVSPVGELSYSTKALDTSKRVIR